MAPEMLEKKNYDINVDIWSLGILLYELTHGVAPFRGSTDNDRLMNMLHSKIKFKVIIFFFLNKNCL